MKTPAPAPLIDKELLQQIDEDIQILVLVRGTLANGSPHYAYASIPFSQYPAFKEAEAAGNYDLTAFGKILAHGPGKTPPADVEKRMRDEYGANHRFEEEVNAWMEELRRARPE